MQKYLACALCGSTELIPNLELIGHGPAANATVGTHVEIKTKPYAVLFSQPVRSDLRAHVCATCGYTVIFAEYPQALKAAYQKWKAATGATEEG